MRPTMPVDPTIRPVFFVVDTLHVMNLVERLIQFEFFLTANTLYRTRKCGRQVFAEKREPKFVVTG